MTGGHYRLPPTGVDALTAAECRALDAYFRQGSWKLAAHDLGLHEQTIKNRATSVLRKLEVASIAQALVIYDRWVRDRAKTWPEVDRRSGTDRRRGVGLGEIEL